MAGKKRRINKYSTLPIKEGDWVHPTMIGMSKTESAYQCEEITEDGKYVVVQTEGTYQHRMTVDKKKLKRL